MILYSLWIKNVEIIFVIIFVKVQDYDIFRGYSLADEIILIYMT